MIGWVRLKKDVCERARVRSGRPLRVVIMMLSVCCRLVRALSWTPVKVFISIACTSSSNCFDQRADPRKKASATIIPIAIAQHAMQMQCPVRAINVLLVPISRIPFSHIYIAPMHTKSVFRIHRYGVLNHTRCSRLGSKLLVSYNSEMLATL